MTSSLMNQHPHDVLFAGEAPALSLPVCDHYAGNARFFDKALTLRKDLGPIFDITLDLEDGAVVGEEARAASWAISTCLGFDVDNRGLGVRIHPVAHTAFKADLDTLLARPCPSLAYLMLPKADSAEAVDHAIEAISQRCRTAGWIKPPALHVLIESPGALAHADAIASREAVQSLSFGIMDYVSHFRGSIPSQAMQSPLQFEHPLLVKAKVDIAMACHRYGKIASHNVCTDFRNSTRVAEDARCARQIFGYQRMWSIHPSQVPLIIEAFAPRADEVATAGAILTKAAAAAWGPIEHVGTLHDRASFRYFWQVLVQAHATGRVLPPDTAHWFSNV